MAGDARGAGRGRPAEARRLNVRSIGLHVFGHNTGARKLYQRLGYRETSVVMRKDLT